MTHSGTLSLYSNATAHSSQGQIADIPLITRNLDVKQARYDGMITYENRVMSGCQLPEVDIMQVGVYKGSS